MSFWTIWDLAFNALVIFVGIGLIWMGLIERFIPSQQVSTSAMIVVAVVGAIVRFMLGYRSARRKLDEADARLEALINNPEEAME